MNERYQGEEGHLLLIEALQGQAIIRNDPAIAESVARAATIQSHAPGAVLIRQDDSDSRLHFILDGEVGILVNGRAVATRRSGEQVGEMALVEPTRRTSTVVATVATTTAVIDERAFRALAQQHPSLWRNIARILARRMRERESALSTPRSIPRLFIGSSGESIPVVEAFRSALAAHPGLVEVTTWRDPDVFIVGRTFIENLVTAVQNADFSLLVMGPDDRVESGSTAKGASRDNVIYELGLFTGTLGRDRTAMAVPVGLDLKIPGDLLGTVPAEYGLGPEGTRGPIDVSSAAGTVERLIRRLGPR